MTTLPPRLQITRTRGANYKTDHPDAINVKRFPQTSRHYGNPWRVDQALTEHPDWTELQAREHVVTLYTRWLDHQLDHDDPAENERRAWILDHLDRLAGHPLGCSCELPEPGRPDWCHAAHLIQLANKPTR